MPTPPSSVRPSRPRRARLAAAAVAACIAAACGGGGGSGGSSVLPGRCSADARKQWVLDVTNDWYLFDDTLPAAVDIDAYASPQALLDFLTETAREQGRDRAFSYLTTRQEDQAFFAEGEFIGFGLRTRISDDSRLEVLEVFENSPAAEGGLARGAVIGAIDAGNGLRSVADWLAEDPELETALGPAETGVTRGFQFELAGVGHEVTLAKRVVTIDPVADAGGAATLPLAGTAGVGYVNLRTFISTAHAQLRQVFDGFRLAGLTDFIVDLRYNGGGLVATSELLGDLFGAARSPSDVFSRTRFNARHSREDSVRRFEDEAAAVAPVRIAFLTTDSTASASELVINSMAPWAEVAIVGGNTFGKPVGQSAFDLSGCDDRLRLVTFRTDNALDEGSYYEGLAPVLTFACSAGDDLSRPMGDPQEGMTAAALDWLGTGQCTSLIAAAPVAKPAAASAARAPKPPRTPLNRHLPGAI